MSNEPISDLEFYVNVVNGKPTAVYNTHEEAVAGTCCNDPARWQVVRFVPAAEPTSQLADTYIDDESRQQFEAAVAGNEAIYLDSGWNATNSDGSCVNANARLMWWAWQASRATAGDEIELLRSQLETERGHRKADNRECRDKTAGMTDEEIAVFNATFGGE